MSAPVDGGQADRFLQLLGKQPDTARLRGFPHRLNPNRFDPKTNPNGVRARKGRYDLAAAARWQAEGCGVYVVINDGGDRKDEITDCRAFFIEWDNKPLDWQLTAWRSLGFDEPTCIITTGGKSAHLYWVLQEPIPPDRWAPIQAALIEAAGADPACKDLSRVMRLPGAAYIGPNGQPTGQTLISAESGTRYTPEQVESWIVSEFDDEPAQADHTPLEEYLRQQQREADFPPRTLEQISEALNRIPQRSPGSYADFRNILWGLIKACEEAGYGIDTAVALMEAHSPSSQYGWDIPQVARSGGQEISAHTFWWHARQHGWRPLSSNGHRPPQGAPGPSRGAQGTSTHPDGQEASQGHQHAPPLLSLDEVRERYRYAVTQGASREALQSLRIELSEASGIGTHSLRELFESIQAEHEATFAIYAEAAAIRAAVDRRDLDSIVTLDFFLPPSVASAIRIRTRSLPADDVACLMCFLATASGVVKLGSQVIVSQAADYQVPLNLYAALVARSGAKKSPLSRLLVSAPTHELRLELAKQHSREMAEWVDQNRGVKPADRPDPPRAVYLSVSDATSEALAAQLQEQERRGLGLLLHRDELAGLFGSFNQYRKGRGGDEEQLLEAYDGSPFRSLRVAASNGGRFYERCHLSVWGTIQPAVLEGLVSSGDASGLWARFMFVPLPDRIVPLPVSESQQEREATAQAALTLAAICGAIYRLPISRVSLSPEARAAFVQYEQRTQRDVMGTTIAAQGALHGKAAGKVLRVAGLLHLIHKVAGDGEITEEISKATMERATTLVDYLNAWTLGLHASIAQGGAANDLMRLIHRVSQSMNRSVTWRDVQQRLSKHQRRELDSAAVGVAMTALAELGVGEVIDGARGGTTYRATGDLPGT